MSYETVVAQNVKVTLEISHFYIWFSLLWFFLGLQSRLDDGFLLRFLRARKFNYDRAYQLLVNYYQIRADNVNIFRDLTPSTVKHVYEDGVICALPKRTPEGRRLYYYRPGDGNIL